MSKIELPPLPDVDTASLAYGGRSVDYIDGYEAGYEAAADQLRARDRQIVEVCAALIEQLRDEHCADTQQAEDQNDRCHPDGRDGCDFVAAWNDAIAAIRNLIEESNNG